VAQKTAAELRGENRVLRRVRFSEGFASIVINLIRWGGVVLISRYVTICVIALAGKATFASIGISFLGNIGVSKTLAWLLGGGGAAYGMSQNRLRKNVVERLQTRIQDLERMIDRKRSSSQLTPRGDTRPEDRL
jgi:hypothetical protein